MNVPSRCGRTSSSLQAKHGMPSSNYQKTSPEPKNAHILKLMHLQYIIILGHVHHLHPQTKRNQGKQIFAGYQHDRKRLNKV